jgi:WXG100 family type VII secretion target
MSTTFQVDTEAIAAAAGDVHRISGAVEAQVAAMMARLDALQGAWRGEASGRFQAVAAEWRATQARVRESLEHVGQTLALAGRQYESAEQHNAALFR